MIYPAFFQNGNHTYAVVFNETTYLEFSTTNKSQRIAYGPSANYIQYITENYQPSTEQAFTDGFQKQLINLKNLSHAF